MYGAVGERALELVACNEGRIARVAVPLRSVGLLRIERPVRERRIEGRNRIRRSSWRESARRERCEQEEAHETSFSRTFGGPVLFPRAAYPALVELQSTIRLSELRTHITRIPAFRR